MFPEQPTIRAQGRQITVAELRERQHRIETHPE
jgi:hypothetical protein